MKINEGVPDFCVSEIYYTSPLINSFRFKDSAPLSKWRGQVQLDYRSDERGAVEFVPRRHREHTDTLSIQFTIDELRPTIDSTFRFYSPERGESFGLLLFSVLIRDLRISVVVILSSSKDYHRDTENTEVHEVFRLTIDDYTLTVTRKKVAGIEVLF